MARFLSFFFILVERLAALCSFTVFLLALLSSRTACLAAACCSGVIFALTYADSSASSPSDAMSSSEQVPSALSSSSDCALSESWVPGNFSTGDGSTVASSSSLGRKVLLDLLVPAA
eukprot:CAMPEP_0113304956 /NCGR_PEP_ID=MMETSP0010_2-20120614/4762_1 /TAXON_ID=216773 ORGANISM="Corethron hystrix, Strain 308" /NCGR_SAMPLE_ID=MMETSP0010_2 /ASSEMBLY_ACC=CAM_ASM_000155 /LENGTH=116 /DNA_ID=CAMNT_0000159251 /DNA_START=329 /DNA_END=675 /DNA_ORIENTATION=- /assembly_acc=CAM_ASM_000155